MFTNLTLEEHNLCMLLLSILSLSTPVRNKYYKLSSCILQGTTIDTLFEGNNPESSSKVNEEIMLKVLYKIKRIKISIAVELLRLSIMCITCKWMCCTCLLYTSLKSSFTITISLELFHAQGLIIIATFVSNIFHLWDWFLSYKKSLLNLSVVTFIIWFVILNTHVLYKTQKIELIWQFLIIE